MQTRSLMMMGLALVGATGCQSYFPNGYGSTGPYFPPGAYVAPPSGQPSNPTYQSGQTFPPGRVTPPVGQMKNEAPLKSEGGGATGAGQKPVPDYRDPVTTPRNLGTPKDDEEPTLRKPTSRRGSGPARLEGFPDDPGEDLSRADDEQFTPPIETASAVVIEDAAPSNRRRATPGLFRHAEDHSFLRGIVEREPQGKGWRLRYSDDPTDGDPYGGTLKLVGHKKIDGLDADDTIYVEGEIDERVKDGYGKPTYRVSVLKAVKPRG